MPPAWLLESCWLPLCLLPRPLPRLLPRPDVPEREDDVGCDDWGTFPGLELSGVAWSPEEGFVSGEEGVFSASGFGVISS